MHMTIHACVDCVTLLPARAPPYCQQTAEGCHAGATCSLRHKALQYVLRVSLQIILPISSHIPICPPPPAQPIELHTWSLVAKPNPGTHDNQRGAPGMAISDGGHKRAGIVMSPHYTHTNTDRHEQQQQSACSCKLDQAHLCNLPSPVKSHHTYQCKLLHHTYAVRH